MSPVQAAREPRWSELTAVFGGRFDPPHLGHVEAVVGLFTNPGVREVVILPSPSPPHKPAVATAQQRLEMTRLAFQPGLNNKLPPEVRVDAREFKRASAHPGEPTYSFNTLSEMRQEFGNSLAFVIGTDQLENLPKWHRFPEILSLCHWIVLERKSTAARAGQKILSEWEASGLAIRASDTRWRFKGGSTHLALVPTPAQALSSTLIRETIARTGNPPEHQLPSSIYTYLKNNLLYGTRPPL